MALALALGLPGGAVADFALLVFVTALPAATYVAWRAHPAPLICGGTRPVALLGQLGNVGLPELVAPDRLLIYAAIVVVLLRGPAMRLRPRIEIQPIHWLLALTVAYVVASALVAGTFFDRAALLRLAIAWERCRTCCSRSRR